MPLTRSDKDKLIAEYQEGLAQAPHAFVLGFKGITVPQVTELRNRVRASGGEYLVVKNTLALRAIDSTALAALQEHFVGPTAVVYSVKDPVALAKALTDYAKDVPAIEFKAGMVESRAEASNAAGLSGRSRMRNRTVASASSGKPARSCARASDFDHLAAWGSCGDACRSDFQRATASGQSSAMSSTSRQNA